MNKPTVILILKTVDKKSVVKQLKFHNISCECAYTIREIKELCDDVDVIIVKGISTTSLKKNRLNHLELDGNVNYVVRVVMEQLGITNSF